MFNIKKQISKLYTSTALSCLSLTGAWVAILAARGFSLVEIGLAETVFHIVSLIFEIPSGVLADVFGRKKMLIVSCIMCAVGNVIMIMSNSLPIVCLSIAFQALNFNFSSGSGDALAYDSMKSVGVEERFEKYESNQFTLYRVCSGISTLCAGFALFIGYKLAYASDLLLCAAQIAVLSTLKEIRIGQQPERGSRVFRSIIKELGECFVGSISFLRTAKRAIMLMLCNALVGAVDTLLLFFLQATLPEAGIPGWALGVALLVMELGGIVGSRFILKFKRVGYKYVFLATLALVVGGVLLEHTGLWAAMALGGFLSAIGDDALQVRTETVLQDMFPSEQRATLISMESFTFSIVMIVLSPLAGVFFSRW